MFWNFVYFHSGTLKWPSRWISGIFRNNNGSLYKLIYCIILNKSSTKQHPFGIKAKVESSLWLVTKILVNKVFLPPLTELSRKYLQKDKSVFRGMVQDSIYDITA